MEEFRLAELGLAHLADKPDELARALAALEAKLPPRAPFPSPRPTRRYPQKPNACVDLVADDAQLGLAAFVTQSAVVSVRADARVCALHGGLAEALSQLRGALSACLDASSAHVCVNEARDDYWQLTTHAGEIDIATSDRLGHAAPGVRLSGVALATDIGLLLSELQAAFDGEARIALAQSLDVEAWEPLLRRLARV